MHMAYKYSSSSQFGHQRDDDSSPFASVLSRPLVGRSVGPSILSDAVDVSVFNLKSDDDALAGKCNRAYHFIVAAAAADKTRHKVRCCPCTLDRDFVVAAHWPFFFID